MPVWLIWTVGGSVAALLAGEGLRRAGEGTEDLTRSVIVASVAATAAALVAPSLIKALRK